MFYTLYRISDGSQPKHKLPHANKFYCLENYIKVFGKEGLILFADNCKEATIEHLKQYEVPVHQESLGNAGSWRHITQYALDHFEDNDIVYLLEDDYLHLPGSKQCIEEALDIADYVSLYDHPDKYVSDGPNPFVDNGGEPSKVLLTASSHWKITNSTTMTFASKVGTLRADQPIWWKYTEKWPLDYKIFWILGGYEPEKKTTFGKKWYEPKRTLITPIPSKSTHIELKWLAPFTNWEEI